LAFDLKSCKKVLVLRWGSMGDLALCSAVMQDLYSALPDAELHLNIEPPWHKLFSEDARFNQLQIIKVRKANRWSSTKEWLGMLRRERFDLIVDLQCNDRSRLLLGLAVLLGIAPRYRIATSSGFPYNITVPKYSADSHALDILRRPLMGLGFECMTQCPVVSIPKYERELAQAKLKDHGLSPKSFAILVPGSSLSGATKRWGSHNYRAMAELFAEHGIERSVILGGPDEVELCAALATDIGPSCVNLCGKTELLEIPVLAENAAYMVSNDTGTAHLAAAANIPMAVICGPTLAKKVHPIGQKVTTLQVDPSCFSSPGNERCMDQCSPEQVWLQLQSLS